MIKVCHITHLASVHPIYEGSNPFVVIRLESNDPSVNEQIQRSSYKPITTSPEWYPPERFLFYTYEADTTMLSQLHFTMYELRYFLSLMIPIPSYSLPGFSESVENIKNLGTMSLALNSILETEKDFTLPLYDANGSLNGAQVRTSFSFQYSPLY